MRNNDNRWIYACRTRIRSRKDIYVEIDAMQGEAPSAAALAYVGERLRACAGRGTPPIARGIRLHIVGDKPGAPAGVLYPCVDEDDVPHQQLWTGAAATEFANVNALHDGQEANPGVRHAHGTHGPGTEAMSSDSQSRTHSATGFSSTPIRTLTGVRTPEATGRIRATTSSFPSDFAPAVSDSDVLPRSCTS